MRIFRKTAAFLCMGAMIFALTACSFSGSVKRNPYDVADSLGQVESGANEGSWLTQLESGRTLQYRQYEEAKKDGYEGSFVDFLKELGGADLGALSVNRALMSSVIVSCSFNRTQTGGLFGDGQERYTSMGSGVIYSVNREKGDAYLITNYHVVYSSASGGKESIPHISDDISVFLYGGVITGREIKATYLGGAMRYDIAVLKVENSEILKDSSALAVVLGNSDSVSVGENVYAVGNPDGEGFSVSSGIISVDAEYVDIELADGSEKVSMLEMRTDAPINHGNSGGGLYAGDGTLLGIVNARSERSGVVNFGYVIPINLVAAVAQNIIDNSGANDSRGALSALLGVTVQVFDSKGVYDPETGKTHTMQTISVVETTFGGMAFGKLREGDVLYSIRISGREPVVITRMNLLTVELLKVRKGDVVTVVFSRGEETMEVEIEYKNNSDFTVYH